MDYINLQMVITALKQFVDLTGNISMFLLQNKEE